MFSIQNIQNLETGAGFSLPLIPDFRLERKELAGLFDVSISTIKRLETQGFIAPQHINCRVLFYTFEAVQTMERLGYRMVPEEAKRLGVPRATPPPAPAVAPAEKLPVARESAGMPAGSLLGFDLAAHQLLATFRWILHQPEIRDEIVRIAREEGMDLES